MRRYAPLLFAFALIGAAVAASPAAQAQGRPSVCFYEHVDFQGRAYCIRVGERIDFVGPAANDRFSSVRIPRGVTVTMCEDANFRGRCRRLYHTEPNFVPMGFNDIVSSVAASWDDDRGSYRGPPDRGRDWDRRGDDRRDWDRRRYDDRPRDRGRDWDRPRDGGRDSDRRGGGGQVCFYEDSSYRGRSFCVPVGQSVKSIGNGLDKKFSSMRSPRGVHVTVCDDKDFHGRCRGFGDNVDYLGNDWNDKISSFRSNY